MNELDIAGIASELDPRQIQTIEMLLNGASVTEIKDSIGVSAAQITRWKNSSPEFARALQETKKHCLEAALHEPKLFAGIADAVDQLIDLVKNAGIDKDRITAAKILFDFYSDARSAAKVEGELQAIKDSIERIGEKKVADIVQGEYNPSKDDLSSPVITIKKPGEIDEQSVQSDDDSGKRSS